jgi:ATP sulfurylase
MSTWVGFFLSLTFFSPVTHFIGHNEFFYVFFDGMLSAGSVWALNSIIEWFEENRPVRETTNNNEIIND